MARHVVHLKPYSKVYVTRRTVIPPRSETFVQCYVDGPFVDDTVGQIEPLPSDSALYKRGISTIESVNKVSGENTFVGMVNDTDNRVILKRGMKVALFSCLPPGAVVTSGINGLNLSKVSNYRGDAHLV